MLCFLQEGKISRHELIQKGRQIVGDKLLISVIKSYRAKFGSLGEAVKSLFLKTRSCADLENEASRIVQVVINQFCCLVLVVI
ncbi:hypothetical protein P8452_12628 [Trifolium repens]|nr:hypothetical protein P8452_12628 [Trifolium repens]